MTNETYKRGFTRQEAMAYVGVKRRTWDTQWEPRLVGMPQGVCVIFDRYDLDRVFDEFKSAAAEGATATADAMPTAHVSSKDGKKPTVDKPSASRDRQSTRGPDQRARDAKEALAPSKFDAAFKEVMGRKNALSATK